MNSPIDRFLDRVRAAESRQQREVIMTLNEARDLHTDITRLLLKLESAAGNNGPETVTIELKGQDF